MWRICYLLKNSLHKKNALSYRFAILIAGMILFYFKIQDGRLSSIFNNIS